MNDLNPIEWSKKYLVDHGFTPDEAKNLLQAITDKSPERLFTESAPKWIEWCAKRKLEYDTVIMGAAQGFITVSYDEDGEMLVGLDTRETK